MPDELANTENFTLTRLELGPYGTNCYIITCKHTGESLVVDAPSDAPLIMQELQGTKPLFIVMTHNHMDHTSALAALKSKLKIPIASHPLDTPGLPCRAETVLHDADMLNIGRLTISIIHTPGHTPGSICLLIEQYLISGDTLFPGGPGHTGTPSALKQILASISSKILTLPDETSVYPGHGNHTTLAMERPAILAFLARQHPDNLCGDVTWL